MQVFGYTVPKGGSSITSTTTTFQSKCRHYQQEVVMPDGTIIYASSSRSWGKPDSEWWTPDLGIYLDGCWKPDTIAYHVGCPDYNIPLPSVAQVMWIAEQGINMAREGRKVEVGCIGGHGRTGLMLAIMATIIKPDIENAVQYVQTVYCKHAVESDLQEWYVKGIKCELAGEEWPEKPTYKSTAAATSGWDNWDDWDAVKWYYAKDSDIPESFKGPARDLEWSRHADDCPCKGCGKVTAITPAVVYCSVCDQPLYSSLAMQDGKHTWDCSKYAQKIKSSYIAPAPKAKPCPDCGQNQWQGWQKGRGLCENVFHCQALNTEKCRCFRHHPESTKNCDCERCKV